MDNQLPLRLHIGCKGRRIDGFKRLDIVQHGDVDYVQDAADLSNFADGTVDEIYASHVIEHIPKPGLAGALEEWNRVLKKGGVMWVSVPDFDRVVGLYLKCGKVLSLWFDHLIHGDQETPYDFHYHCFTYQTLSGFLSKAGFEKIREIENLPYGVQDASRISDSMFNEPISLNMQAVK